MKYKRLSNVSNLPIISCLIKKIFEWGFLISATLPRWNKNTITILSLNFSFSLLNGVFPLPYSHHNWKSNFPTIIYYCSNESDQITLMWQK